MIKAALQYIIDLQRNPIHNIFNQTYTEKSLTRVDEELRAENISCYTLTAITDYLKHKADPLKDGKYMVHIVSPTEVRLISGLDADRKRETLLVSKALKPDISFNQFMNQESFNIMIQSMFIDNEYRAAVLQVSGCVEDKTVHAYSDDGISQSATIRTGVASKEEIMVPNPVRLKPYRSFFEIDQTESQFVFRMKSDTHGVSCAIFEADGGAWKAQTVQNIKAYLVQELKDNEQVVIMA